MSITCPNKRLKSWKDLVKVQGEDKSYLLWSEYEGNVPEQYYTVSKPKVITPAIYKRGDIDPLIQSKYFPEKTVSSLSIVQKIAASNHPLNKLAERLLPYVEKLSVPVTLNSTESVGNSNAAGIYTPSTNNIDIAQYCRFRGRGSEVTLLHEVIHSLTYSKLRDESSTAVMDLTRLYDYAKANIESDFYGLTNIDEFITELFTSAEFVNELMKISPTSEVSAYKNFFEELVEHILSLFGITNDDNLYSQAFAVATNIIEEYSNETLIGEDLRTVWESTTPEYMDYQEPEVLASKAVPNKSNPPRAFISNVKSTHRKPAVVNDVYIPEIGSSINKRYITSYYFRYKDARGQLTIPYYPFTLGNMYANKALVKMINSEFLEPVVRINPNNETIVFTDVADASMSVEEVNDIYYEYVTKPEIEKRMAEMTDDIVGEEEMLFLQIDTEEEKRRKQKEKDDNGLTSSQLMVERKKELIRLMRGRIAKSSERRPEIQARIDRLTAQINELIDKATPQEVINQGNDDNIEIKNRLIKIQASFERLDQYDANQIWSYISDLNDISSFIKGWADIAKFMDFSDTPAVRTQIATIGMEMEERRLESLKLLKMAFSAYASKVSFKKFGDELYDALKDESWISRNTLGAQFSNSDIVRIVNDLIQKSAYNINVESYEKQRELDLWYDKLKKHTGLPNTIEMSKLFLQYNKGVWTGNLVGRIRQEYFEKKKELRDKAKITNTAEDWKAYYKFVKNNSVEMTGTIFASKSHPAFTAKDFEIQERLLNEYEKVKDEYKKSLQESGIYGTVDNNGVFSFNVDPLTGLPDPTLKAKFDSVMAEWERLNKPFDAAGKPINTIGGNNWKYRIWEKPDVSKWGDPQYEKIQNDPVLREFYEFLNERFKENNEELPPVWGLQSNYLPTLRRTAIENFTENKSVATAMAMVNDARLDTFTQAVDSDIETDIIIGSAIYRSIPVGMMSDNLSPEVKSKDIFRILKEHTEMALNYKYKSQIEPIATAAQDVIKEVKEIQEINKSGTPTPIRDIYNNIFKREDQLFNTRSRLEYLINAELYGRRKAAEYKGKKIKTKSTGETVVFSQSQVIDSLIKYTYVKALSIPNIVTPAVNLTLGLSQNYIYASAGKNIDSSSLTWGYSKVWKAASKTIANAFDLEDAKMVVAWMRHLNILDNINEAAYGKSETWDRWLTQLQSKGEFINQGAVMMAYLKKNTLVDKNGKEIPIIEAFKIVDNTPVWNTDKMGEMTQPEAHEIFSADKKGVNMFRLRMKIKGVNFYIHGDYASALQGKETSVGRAIMLFKTWLFQTWMHRFGREMYDQNLQEMVKGRYKSYMKAYDEQGLELARKELMKLMLKGIFTKRAFDGLSEIDRDNMIRNMKELQILSILTVVAMLLTGAAAGDDEPAKNQKMLNLLINLMSKTQVDMMFYLNPASTGQVLNNLVAPINTINDMMALYGAVYKTIQGDPEYDSGPFKDQNRILVNIGKNLPVVNSGIKMINTASRVYSYN